MTASTSVQNDFINAIHSWLSSGLTSTPFGDRFEDNTGANSANEARPVVGGNLAVFLIFLSLLQKPYHPLCSFFFCRGL